MGKYGVAVEKTSKQLNTIDDVINANILYLRKNESIYIRVNPVVNDMIDKLQEKNNLLGVRQYYNLSKSDIISLAVQELYKKNIE